MKKPFSFRSKSFSLAFLLVMLAVALSLVSVLICGAQFRNVTQQFLTKHFSELSSKRFTQATDYISDAFTKAENMAAMIAEDSELLQILADYSSSQDAKQADLLSSQVYEMLIFVSKALPDIHAVSLCTNITTFTSLPQFSASALSQDDLLALFGWTKGQQSLFFPGDSIPDSGRNNRFVDHHCEYILYAFPLMLDHEVCATVIFTLDPSFLLDEDSSGEGMALLRYTGHLLYNSTDYTGEALEALAQEDADGNIAIMEYPEYGLHFLFQPDVPVLDQHIARLTTAYCIVGAILIVIAILLSDFIIRPILRPLHSLKEALETMQDNFSFPAAKPARFFSQRHIFLFLTSITLTTTILFTGISYFYFRNTALEMLTASIDTSFRQAEKKVENVLSNYEYISVQLAYSEMVQEHFLEGTGSADPGTAPGDFLKNGTLLFDLPTNMQIYNSDGTLFYSVTSFPAISGDTLFTEIGRKAEYRSVPFWGGYSILVTRQLINTRTMQASGYLSLQTDELHLSKTFDFFPSPDCAIYLHRADGTVLSSNDKAAIGKVIPAVDPLALVFSHTFENTGLSLTLRYNTNALNHEFNASIRNLLYQLLFLLSLLGLINFFISHYLSIQFRRLAKTLYNVSLDTDTEHFLNGSLVREINQVYTAFNNMSSRIQSLVSDILAAEASRHALELEKKQSDFLLLQSQINPHFLYNTFEAINGLIVSGKDNEAVITLNSLADMLRFSTKNNLLSIPVREEIEYIRRYINIMHLRYPEQLSLSLNITEEAMQQETVKFILQPILENAIYHGFKPKGGHGHISVTGTVFDGKLLFVIRDDGIGMSPAKCCQLQQAIDQNISSPSIGLRNIANRLRLLHGSAASLTISSTEGYGTVVTVVQPVNE